MPLAAAAQPLLPGLYDRTYRARTWSALPTHKRLVAAARAVSRCLDAIVKTAGPEDRPILTDRRFRLALAVVLPLSLGGPAPTSTSFRTVCALASKILRERGAAGPAGLAVLACVHLSRAVLGPQEHAGAELDEAVETAIEASVSHAALRAINPSQARSQLEHDVLACVAAVQ
jgi:hypothetical protein